MAIETELKFTVPDRKLFAEIVSLETIADYSAIDCGTKIITDTYFDTADSLLYNGKAVFRLRRKNSGRVLTFKSQQRSEGSFYRRNEIEYPVDIDPDAILNVPLPDNAACHAFEKMFGSVQLIISMTAVNNRHTILLDRDGTAEFELVLDDVTFTGPRGAFRACELEVESLGGADAALEKIGAWLRKKFKLSNAGPSKYILGMTNVGNISSGGNADDS